jgi:drug/metabolite transporter (DMT)-like permease
MFLPLLLFACFAAIFIISKISLFYAAPFFLVGVRMAFAGVCLLAYKKTDKTLPKKYWPKIALLAFFSIYLTNVCEFWGLKYLTSAKTCFIYSLSPFISSILAYYLLSERMTIKKWGGLLVAFFGFIPILVSTTAEEASAGSFFCFSWPEIAVMGAAAFSSYGWILLKDLVGGKDGLSPLTANGYAMLLGGFFALIHSFFLEPWEPFPVTAWQPFIALTLILIILSNVICYNLYGWLLQRFSATFMSLVGYSTPFFTALFGYLFLHEQIGASFYLSSSIVLLGLLLFYQEELKVRLATRY